MKDFFISYNRHDKHWAEWIAWTLEEAGYTVVIQVWDFRPGGNFVLDMQRASAECQKTIAVLSQNYLQSEYAQSEWGAAFASDPQSLERKLIPIRVGECSPEGLLRTIVYVDLVDVPDERVAKEKVLNALKERAKPAQKPGFPGKTSERIALQHTPFPGGSLRHPQASPSAPKSSVEQRISEHEEFIEDEYLCSEEDSLKSLLGKSVEQTKAIIQKGRALYGELDLLLDNLGEARSFIVWSVIIGFPIITTASINFSINKSKCEDRIQKFDSQDVTKGDPEHSFKRGTLQYGCRSYLGEELYITSFKEASSNAKSDPKIWQLFVDEANRIRENAQTDKELNISRDSKLEYSAFLFEQATEIQPNNFKAWLELGKVYQMRFQNKPFQPDLIVTKFQFDEASELLEKAIVFYGLAIEKYDESSSKINQKIEVLVPKGYALILKGDFIKNNLVADAAFETEEKLKVQKLEKSNEVYQEAVNFFDLTDKTQPHESSILMGKAIALSRLGLTKESCIEYRRAMHVPTQLKNFGSFISPMLREVKCSTENAS